MDPIRVCYSFLPRPVRAEICRHDVGLQPLAVSWCRIVTTVWDSEQPRYMQFRSDSNIFDSCQSSHVKGQVSSQSSIGLKARPSSGLYASFTSESVGCSGHQ